MGFIMTSGLDVFIFDQVQASHAKDKYLHLSRVLLSHPFQWINNIRGRTAQGLRWPFHLLQAHTFPTTYCSDPKDKIYATAALASEFVANGLTTCRVDYNEPTFNTYIRASRRSLEASGTLDLLSISVHPDRHSYLPDLQLLPSWCPNYSWNDFFHGRPPPLALHPDPTRVPRTFAAFRGSLLTSIDQSSTSPLLAVRGSLKGKVANVARSSIRFDETDLMELSDLLDLLLLFRTPTEPLADMFWRTLVHDMYDTQNGNQPYPAAMETRHCFFILFHFLLSSTLSSGRHSAALERQKMRDLAPKIARLRQMDPDACSIFPDFERYLSMSPDRLADESFWESDRPEHLYLDPTSAHVALMTNIQSKGRKRRVFSTSDQRLGISIETIQPEDEIWLLAGGRVPYILRKRTNGNYEFIGEAYVHGIMMGEAWPEDEGELVHVVLE